MSFCDVVRDFFANGKRNIFVKINCCADSIIVWATGSSFQHCKLLKRTINQGQGQMAYTNLTAEQLNH